MAGETLAQMIFLYKSYVANRKEIFMDTKSTVLSFEGFFVDRFSFERNNNFDFDIEESIELSQSIHKEIVELEHNHYLVKLVYESGREDKDKNGNPPFVIEIEVAGKFKLISDDTDANIIINQNAVAILFPYLRALLTTLTANANVPPLILPAVNIARMLEEQEEDESKKTD